jgi:hypothetical protein
VASVVERLDAEAVPGGEQRLTRVVPQGEGKLAAQLVETTRAEVLVQVEEDLAVRAGGEAVAALLELGADPREVVELAVHDRVHPAVLVGQGLVAGGKVDDAEASVPEPHPT